jgi:hypothetical protein
MAPILAIAVPTIELITASLLAIPKFRKIGLYASLNLMTMFTAYIIAILTISDHIPCACGGVLSKMGWTEHLIFNIIFTILPIIAIVLSSNNEIESIPNSSLMPKKTIY